MIIVNSSKGKVAIPNAWDELSPEQYLNVVRLIYNNPITGTSLVPMVEFRIKLLEMLTGYRRSNKKYTIEQIDEINSLLSILALKLTFVYKPVYKTPEIFGVMSAETAQAIRENFPYDLIGTEHEAEVIRLQQMLTWYPTINYNMKHNPIPTLTIKPRNWWNRSKLVGGPIFDIDEMGVVFTSITAEEYIDAQEYYQLFNSTHKKEYLIRLCSVFYRDYAGQYNTLKSSRMDLSLHVDFALGFYHFFQNIQEYFFNHPVYGLLYQGTKTRTSEKISLGNIESLYNASTKGYGNIDQMKNFNVIDYMNLLVKDIKDAVNHMRAFDKKDFQIAKDMSLPLETIKKL